MIARTALSAGRRALIGHTGLVGSNLARQTHFDDCYNSANIADIAGREYDLVVCSGARGTKWIANLHPEQDRAEIGVLLENLEQVRAGNLILISTVDVYGVPSGVDEDSPIDASTQTAYGRHRHFIEQVLRERFPRILVVRLPALFGTGLRKNALYDLMWNHEIEKIHPAAVYQFYWLDHLWSDIELAVAGGLTVGNFATAPIAIRDLARDIFGIELSVRATHAAPAAGYDFRTKYDRLFGGAGGYLRDRATVLREIRQFVESSRRAGAPA